MLKISEYDRWKQVVIASFYQETLQAVREAEPRAQTYGAESEIRLFYILHLMYLEKLNPYKLNGFAIPMQSGGINLATPRFVRVAKNAGLFLHYWTINNESDMRLLMDMGVDGLMTDRPELLLQIRSN
ncbi:MAG: hypothetical protein JKY88_00185 [Pseudomonadales bacterium]|nr:hypothetical protein [Pseudomonadales bacterium]